MTLVNLSLLFGAGAIAIPIVLHLLLRQQPRRMKFPAIQFLVESQQASKRSLQWRHWLLLALRCLAFLLLAVVLARPQVASGAIGAWLLVPIPALLSGVAGAVAVAAKVQGQGRAWVAGGGVAATLLAIMTAALAWHALGAGGDRLGQGRGGPVAAVLLFDTASRMEFRHENRSRLEAARAAATQIVRQLPEGSVLAVVDARPDAPLFAQDRAAALTAIERLETSGAARPIADLLDGCRFWLSQNGPPAKELYVFTDSSRGAWPDRAASFAANATGALVTADAEGDRRENGPETANSPNALSNLPVNSPDVGNSPKGGGSGTAADRGPVGKRGTSQAGNTSENRGNRGNRDDSVSIYLVDVGVEQPRNAGLGALRLSAESLPLGGELVIETEVAASGLQGPRGVEVTVESPDPERPVVRDGNVEWPEQKIRGATSVTLDERVPAAVTLRLGGLAPGLVHGTVRLAGEDGLRGDNTRYFSVQVRAPAPVIIVAGADTVPSYFVEAVAPREFRAAGKSEFACQEVSVQDLAKAKLDGVAAICLLDPPPLPLDDWNRLAAFVEQGGGLGVFLGHNARAGETFHDPAVERLLGGIPRRLWRSPNGELFLAPDQYDHPVTREFREIATSVPWDRFPVYRHWELAPSASARTVLRFGNRMPALTETTVGRGRVLVLATPLSDPARPQGRDAWNELPTAPDAWPFVVLADQIVRYLAAGEPPRLNYETGEVAEWRGAPDAEPDRYRLFTPASGTRASGSREVATRDGRASLGAVDQPGNYRLRGFRDQPLDRGLSVNLPPSATEIARVDAAEFDRILGAGRYRRLVGGEQMERDVGDARAAGTVEFYPSLLLALVAVLGLEQLVSNRFYGRAP